MDNIIFQTGLSLFYKYKSQLYTDTGKLYFILNTSLLKENYLVFYYYFLFFFRFFYFVFDVTNHMFNLIKIIQNTRSNSYVLDADKYTSTFYLFEIFRLIKICIDPFIEEEVIFHRTILFIER